MHMVEGNRTMQREQEQQLYRMQAELCQTLADPTRLELLNLLRGREEDETS
jgi:hypothetical protein